MKALVEYTNESYKSINSALRNGQKVDVNPIIEDLNSLPTHQGISYRGVSTSRLNIEVGGTYSDPAFLSTSKVRVEALAYGNKENKTLLHIKGKSGRDVSSISRFPEEEEVLFPPSTLFMVEDKKLLKIGGTKIPVYILREV